MNAAGSLSPDVLEAAIDESLVVDLAKRVIETPSPTGDEADFARLLVEVWGGLGLDSRLQTIYDDRFNAVARLPGDPGGVRVLWSGHMDTSVRGDEPWLTGRGWKNAASIDDGIVWGNGIRNMKSAFVAYTAAVDALARIGATLPGDLVLAGTSGEIEIAPVDEFAGREFDSTGMGLRHLLTHGVVADYHLLGEPTGLVPYLGNPGAVWAKVTVAGSFSHTAFSDHAVNAVEEMWALWRGLDDWIAEYQDANTREGIRPQVNRSAIRGGMPWRAARTPSSCSMYIDIRLPPDRYPVDVQREFEGAVRDVAARVLRSPADVEWYFSRPGTMVSASSPLVTRVGQARADVLGRAEEPVPYIGVCSDAMDANRLGVPTLQFGVGRRPGEASRSKEGGDVRAAEGEFCRIDDIVEMAKIFLLATEQLMVDGVTVARAARGPMPTGTATQEAAESCP